MLPQTLFQMIVAATGSLAAAGLGTAYFKRVRLDRPSIGTFNGRDLVILFVFIVSLPVLYLALPTHVLTFFLAVTFTSALCIPYSKVVPGRWLVPAVLVLLGANIAVTYTLLGSRSGYQLYWVMTSVMVILAAAGVGNLYIQGGMRLRHVAWFALALGVYDLIFASVIPLTPLLADTFEGRPLDPAVGFVVGPYTANIGLGDLLVYALFAIAAYRGFGRRGVVVALGTITAFGAVVPALTPLLLSGFTREGIGIVVPAQTFFGPAAFLAYRRLSRQRERTPAEWIATPADATLAGVR